MLADTRSKKLSIEAAGFFWCVNRLKSLLSQTFPVLAIPKACRLHWQRPPQNMPAKKLPENVSCAYTALVAAHSLLSEFERVGNGNMTARTCVCTGVSIRRPRSLLGDNSIQLIHAVFWSVFKSSCLSQICQCTAHRSAIRMHNQLRRPVASKIP